MRKGQIVALVEEGVSHREIARRIGCSVGTVAYIRKKWTTSNSVQNKKACGRPRKLRRRTIRWLDAFLRKNRNSRLCDIRLELYSASGILLSKKSIRRYMKRMGYKCCRASKKPYVSGVNMRKRYEFSTKFEHLTPAQLSHIIWSDESSFKLFGVRGLPRVWRRKGERFHHSCVVPTVKHGVSTLMI